MREDIGKVIETWKMVFQGNYLWVVFLLAVLYLIFAGPDKRKKIVYPVLILMVVVLEPHLFQYLWSRLAGDTHWRMFWLIPMIPVIVYAAIHIIGRIRSKALAALVLAGFMLTAAGAGNYVYANALTAFQPAENAYKIPQYAVTIADVLLEQEDHPKVVVQEDLYHYLRLYSADIEMMYGRDADGYISRIGRIPRKTARLLASDEPELRWIAKAMKKLGYR